MHLHGYSFYVIGSGYGVFDNETDPKSYNFVDPPKLSTVTLPKNGWVALRFKASNPGMYISSNYLVLSEYNNVVFPPVTWMVNPTN